MDQLIQIIKDANDALPDKLPVAANGTPPAARDWAGFFAALAAFATKLLPLIMPLLADPKTK